MVRDDSCERHQRHLFADPIDEVRDALRYCRGAPEAGDPALRHAAVVKRLANLVLLLCGIGLPFVGLEIGLRAFHAVVKSRSSYRPVDGNSVFVGKPHAWGEINAIGVRDREHPRVKPAGVFRILVLGDSVTAGYGVDFEDMYIRRLQTLLDRSGGSFEVVSLATDQYSTVQEVARLQDLGLDMSPNLVMLAYVLNDPATDGNLNEFFRRDRAPSLALDWLWSRLGSRAEPSHPRVAGCEPHDYYSWLHCDADRWAQSETALDRLAQLSQQHGFAVLLALFPVLDSERPSFEPYAWQRTNAQVLEAAMRRHFATVDLLPWFARRRPAELALDARDMLHPNRVGHEIAATAIYEALVEQGLIR